MQRSKEKPTWYNTLSCDNDNLRYNHRLIKHNLGLMKHNHELMNYQL